MGQLAYTLRNSQKSGNSQVSWDELSTKAQKAFASTLEKTEKLSQSFIEGTSSKLSALKLTDADISKLKSNWDKQVESFKSVFNGFTSFYNKFINKFSKDPASYNNVNLKCAKKDYPLISFLSLLDGTLLNNGINADIDSIRGVEDWVALANTLKVPPCNVPGLVWEKNVKEVKEEL